MDLVDHGRDVLDASLDEEEIFGRQRSKALWLKESDRNTKYFHDVASKMKRNNKIKALKDEGGCLVRGPQLCNLLKNYFRELFSPSDPYDFDRVLLC